MAKSLLFLLLFVSNFIVSQQIDIKKHQTVLHVNSNITDPQIFTNQCQSKDHNEILFQDPIMHQARQSAKQLTRQLETQMTTSANRGVVYRIPVVFHVIHKGEAVGSGTNVSDAQLISAIEALNRDFRRTNADGGIAQGLGPDTEIEFCLASKDPGGNPHSGINRVNGTSVTDYTNQGIIGSNEVAVKALSIWDNRYYLNIWVVSEIDNNGADVGNLNLFGGGTIGYAYYPTNPVTFNASRDGIVILNCSVGNDPTGTNGYRLWFATERNRALSHEVGHYLDLIHTFEYTASCTSETNCNLDGDEICDTPPTTLGSSCGSPVCSGAQIENYMDYTSETCQNMFSNGQTTRMRAALAGVRNALVNTNNCDAPVLVADFIANITTVGAGNTVSFTDLTTGGTPTSWSWSFGGGGTPNLSSSQNPTITFNTPGTYSVQLIVSDGVTSDTIFKSNYITVSSFNPLVCDTLNNFIVSENLLYYNLSGYWGYYPGHNELGMDAYAEPFTVLAPTEVQKVILPIFQADTGITNSSINIVVYDDNGGEPGTVLGSHTQLISTLIPSYYNTITLSSPVAVSGNFWVGVEINYVPGDTVILGTAEHRTSGPSTTFLRASGSWYSTQTVFSGSLQTSLDLAVLTSGSPAISFTESTLNTSAGSTVAFDASSSSGYSAFLWAFNGGSPDTAYNLIENITYNFPGLYDIKLFMLGGCRLDSLVKQINVYATTDLEKLILENINVYPNPTHNDITIELNNGIVSDIKLELIDFNGKVINTQYLRDNANASYRLSMDNIAKGVYQLRLSSNEAQTIKRIIKN